MESLHIINYYLFKLSTVFETDMQRVAYIIDNIHIAIFFYHKNFPSEINKP